MSAVFDMSVELCKILKANYYDNHPQSWTDYEFLIDEGRKYYKIVMHSGQRSVHAFVDKVTGDIYKPAGWASPAKGVRFNIFRDLELLRRIGAGQGAMWAGGYLYK